MNSFHNTTFEPFAELQQSEKKAQAQEDTILFLFRRHNIDGLTPDQVYEKLYAHTKVPITSVRRAITNLTNQGLLEKTNDQRMGSYGKKVSVWRIPRKPGVQISLFEYQNYLR